MAEVAPIRFACENTTLVGGTTIPQGGAERPIPQHDLYGLDQRVFVACCEPLQGELLVDTVAALMATQGFIWRWEHRMEGTTV
jgi:hypothetical protein